MNTPASVLPAIGWYETPLFQKRRAKKHAGESVLISEAPPYVARPESEKLLLHVPGSCEDMFGRIDLFDGQPVCYSIQRSLSRAGNVQAVSTTQLSVPTWIGFDPAAVFDVEEAWCHDGLLPDGRRAAGPEVLSALWQFPKWRNAWNGRPVVLAGYQVGKGGRWPDVPCLSWNGQELRLSSTDVRELGNCLTPAVRLLG